MLAIYRSPSGASAATIGSDLKGSPNPGSGYSCGIGIASCAVQQLELPADRTKAPFRGVIRSWRFRTVVDPEKPGGWKLRLRIVRKTAPGQFKFVRKSKPGRVKKPGRHRFKSHAPRCAHQEGAISSRCVAGPATSEHPTTSAGARPRAAPGLSAGSSPVAADAPVLDQVRPRRASGSPTPVGEPRAAAWSSRRPPTRRRSRVEPGHTDADRQRKPECLSSTTRLSKHRR